MSIDYTKLTEKARATLSKATGLTESCCYASVEPQVLMIALIQENKDMVYYILQQLGVDKSSFCQAIGNSLAEIACGDNPMRPLSETVLTVVDKANLLARNSGSRVTAPEHLFWAFSDVPSQVKQIMSQFGLSENRVASAISAYRGGEIRQTPRQEINADNGSGALSTYSRNLTQMAENGEIEPVIGRDNEIRRILQILSRKTKNNPLLVGPPGTGKTAIIEGLANRIVRGDVPQELLGTKIYSLDISSLIAGTACRGSFEERLNAIMDEAQSDPQIVLFIDEIHLLINAGGAMNAANILKPELARGIIRVIGATTVNECTKFVETDKAFERRFQKVTVDEPDTEAAITMLRGIKPRFESYHRIKILDEAVVAAVKLSQRYISDRYLPDKAIDLLDEAASRMRLERSSAPKELDALSRRICSKEMERESLCHDDEAHDLSSYDAEIANLREQENVLKAKWMNERQQLEDLQSKRDILEQMRVNFEQAQSEGRFSEAVVLQGQIESQESSVDALIEELNRDNSTLLKTSLDEGDIREVVTSWTGIPVNKLTESDNEKLLHLEDILKSSVIGQDRAVSAVSKVIRRNQMGLGDPSKPIGTFLFLGTTGIGKTELAKTLADYLFDSPDMMVRIDMSEYQQEHSVSRLFGAPPGYVGYDQGGQLTEAVRHKPFSVVLLDEIEKAHSKVFETLLQVMDDGRMTDGQGRTVDFRNVIIIMTSNIGADGIADNLVGRDVDDESISAATNYAMDALRRKVSPEFINRIDDIVMFLPLGKVEIKKIVELQMNRQKESLAQKDICITFDDSVIELLSEIGYQPEYGARPVKRAVADNIVDELPLKFLKGELNRSLPINIIAEAGTFIFQN